MSLVKTFCKECGACDIKMGTPYGVCHRKSPEALHDGSMYDRFPKVNLDGWCWDGVPAVKTVFDKITPVAATLQPPTQHEISESMGMVPSPPATKPQEKPLREQLEMKLAGNAADIKVSAAKSTSPAPSVKKESKPVSKRKPAR